MCYFPLTQTYFSLVFSSLSRWLFLKPNPLWTPGKWHYSGCHSPLLCFGAIGFCRTPAHYFLWSAEHLWGKTYPFYRRGNWGGLRDFSRVIETTWQRKEVQQVSEWLVTVPFCEAWGKEKKGRRESQKEIVIVFATSAPCKRCQSSCPLSPGDRPLWPWGVIGCLGGPHPFYLGNSSFIWDTHGDATSYLW